jgi:hypothetical protein
MDAVLRCLRVMLIGLCVSWCAVGWCADAPLAIPVPPPDVSAEIIQCDPNSCQVSDRLIGSMAGLPGCLVDLTTPDGQRQVRQVDNFRKPGTRLQPAGEVKVMYHSWLDTTQAKSAKLLGFLSGSMERNDRLEVKSTLLPGMSCLPEDLDYAKIAAAFEGKTQAEKDRYGIVMSVVAYEVSGAVYNTSNRNINVDWPCFSLAGGKSLLYKSGQESSKCFLMAVYAPIPFCLQLEAVAKTPPTKSTHDHGDDVKATSIPDAPDTDNADLSHLTDSRPVISKLLKMWVSTHKPQVAFTDAPRAVIAPEVR